MRAITRIIKDMYEKRYVEQYHKTPRKPQNNLICLSKDVCEPNQTTVHFVSFFVLCHRYWFAFCVLQIYNT